jgi:hypothetical protein
MFLKNPQTIDKTKKMIQIERGFVPRKERRCKKTIRKLMCGDFLSLKL